MSGVLREDIRGLLSSIESSNGVLISAGLVDGMSSIVKFGHCPNAVDGVETVAWERGGVQPIYIFPDSAGEELTIESTEIADTQEITYEVLDSLGDEVEGVITLNGQAPVAIVGSVIAVNRAFNSDSTPITGTVLIKGAVSGNIFATIDPNEQQTTQCIYTVPSKKYAIVRNISTSINEGGNQDNTSIVKFSTQELSGVFRTSVRYGLQQRGTSNISSDIVLPPLCPPLTRLKVSFIPDSLQDVSAEMSIQLIDSNLIEI